MSGPQALTAAIQRSNCHTFLRVQFPSPGPAFRSGEHLPDQTP